MSDDVAVPGSNFVPIQDTLCECGHWYEEHGSGTVTECDSCYCAGFVADPEASTAEAIMARGGAPELWPQHVLLVYHAQCAKDAAALDRLNLLLSATTWPGASGLEDVAMIVRGTGRKVVEGAPGWPSH